MTEHADTDSTIHRDSLRAYAVQELGFDRCGFCSPALDRENDTYRSWLGRGYHGSMEYLVRHARFKEDPGLLLPGVRSAVVVIKNYRNTTSKTLDGPNKVARYAAGRDYHEVIGTRLSTLSTWIEQTIPGARCYCGVDSRPIAERALALKAGLGFRGKNTMVILPGMGSYFFIGVVLTTANLAGDTPMQWDCGACRICIDTCPTGAILETGSLDATRCISYFTIEQKQETSAEQRRLSQGWIFGCDICQEVCPYNHSRAPLTDWQEFYPAHGVGFSLSSGVGSEIPRDSALYRSRARVQANLKASPAGKMD